MLYYLFRDSIDTLKGTFAIWAAKYQNCLNTQCAYEEDFIEKNEGQVVEDLFKEAEEDITEYDMSDFRALAA